MRLSPDTLAGRGGVATQPSYDRSQNAGIVHFGIGAFHRAHQAWYTDACLAAGERDWMTTGVSMRSARVANQLNPQGGLFTLTERSRDGEETRAIGAVQGVLIAGRDRSAIAQRLARPECHVASFTVTEKGYCRASDGSLDRELARAGFYPLLTDALMQRRQAGRSGLTLLSCDNLSGNGSQLGRLMRDWLAGEAPGMVDWFDANCSTPDSMVDRIVPATTERDIASLEDRIGLRDEGAVFTEPFSQWIIADDFAGARPRWDDHGAKIVTDVTPYETAKLRMLNGAHSLLAYAGLDAGHKFVHQAIANPVLRGQTLALMREEAAPTIAAGEGQNLTGYADALIARFENPGLDHRLFQIAMDGSQKIPQRWLETLAIQRERGRRCPVILQGIGHWLLHVRGDRRPVEDPLADRMRALWRQAGVGGIVNAIFGRGGLLASQWQPDRIEAETIRGVLLSESSL
ncbi:mannitol dehydrogenase family protein [Aurantiacibacter spongiae]|uniref:mannitol dehydrogenase family protein n=1 Tax=Aurantiacibacter spongiae TaxID=2488860 RepID=UPI001F464FF7|nr:mannitol dehydrogenase family protein [Aurantiacibacter spongiae]